MKNIFHFIILSGLLYSCSNQAENEREYFLSESIIRNNLEKIEILDEYSNKFKNKLEKAPKSHPIFEFADNFKYSANILFAKIDTFKIAVANEVGILVFPYQKDELKEKGYLKLNETTDKTMHLKPVSLSDQKSVKEVMQSKNGSAALNEAYKIMAFEFQKNFDELEKYAKEKNISNFKTAQWDSLKNEIIKSIPNPEKLESLFKNASVSRCLLTLNLLYSQSLNSVLSLQKFLFESISDEIVFDKYELYMNREKPFVKVGENFNSEIGLLNYASKLQYKASVDGKPLTVKDGRAYYSEVPKKTGKHSVTVTFEITNPRTNKVEIVKQEFSYEVLAPF